MSCWDSRGQRPAPLRGPGPPPPGLALSPNSCMTPGKLGTTLPESATFTQSAGRFPPLWAWAGRPSASGEEG